MPLRLPVLASSCIKLEIPDNIHTKIVKIYKNPTLTTCKSLATKFKHGFRGIAQDNIYIWDAYEATHLDVFKQLRKIKDIEYNLNMYFIVTDSKYAEDDEYHEPKWKTYNNYYVYFEYGIGLYEEMKLEQLFPEVD